MTKSRPTTSPPSCSTRSTFAFAVPPVASTSSWTITRAPRPIASAWTCRLSVAVLERVGHLDGLPRELARLARGHEAAAEPVRERAAEDEAASLRAEDDVGTKRSRERLEAIDRLPEVHGIGDEWHHVLEHDPRLREVRVRRECGRADPGSCSSHGRDLTRTLGEYAQLAPEEEARELLRGLGERVQILEARSCGARRCATAAPARRAAPAGPPRGRRSCGTSAGAGRRCRTWRGVRTRRRCPRRLRGRDARRLRRAA